MGTATAEADEWADAPVARRPGRAAGAWIAALLLLGVSIVVGCRIADTDGITPVPQLIAFLPWLLAPTGLALLLAALARWRVGLVWGVLAAAAVAWFIEPYGKTSEPQGTPVAELRVLTSNVEFGQATDELIETVRREKPDLVFVEECETTCDEKLTRAFGGDRARGQGHVPLPPGRGRDTAPTAPSSSAGTPSSRPPASRAPWACPARPPT